MSDATTRPVCPCGSTRYRRILASDRYCVYGDNIEQGSYELLRCSACALIRTWPQPADEDHEPFRDETFLGSYLERADLFASLLRPTVDDIARLAPPPGKLIDVGANIGMIVGMARDLGYDATGIELNEAAVEHGRANGLQMLALPLEKAGIALGSLDVICLSATAEHIPDLDETFALCADLLRTGGLLYVSNSPNHRSLAARLERDLWYGIQPTGHVWQFTPKTLRDAFVRSGFEVVSHQTYNMHRDWGRNRKQRLKKAAFNAAERFGFGDALSMAGVKP